MRSEWKSIQLQERISYNVTDVNYDDNNDKSSEPATPIATGGFVPKHSTSINPRRAAWEEWSSDVTSDDDATAIASKQPHL